MSSTSRVTISAFVLTSATLFLSGCGSTAEEKVASKPPTPAVSDPVDAKAAGKTARRNVKTAIDPEASKIDSSAKETTVEDIVAQKAPTGQTLAGRVAPFETSTWKVKATLASVKLMKDGDYYLVMKGEKGGETVVEVPDPKDCKGSPLLPQITAARKKLEERYHPTKDAKEIHDQATVTGVGFLGFEGKKTGKSKVGSRLMPGLDFSF